NQAPLSHKFTSTANTPNPGHPSIPFQNPWVSSIPMIYFSPCCGCDRYEDPKVQKYGTADIRSATFAEASRSSPTLLSLLRAEGTLCPIILLPRCTPSAH